MAAISLKKASGGKKGVGFFTVAVFLVVLILLSTGHAGARVGTESVKIKSTYWPSKEIPKEEILSVSFREDFDTGRRVGGFGSFVLSLGRFQNEVFGKYDLYANNRCKAYVVMETVDGMVVVNEKKEEATKALYEEIRALIDQQEGTDYDFH